MTPPWDWDEKSRASLEAFLRDRDLVEGTIETRAIGDGHSNLTYLVSDGERRVVVRRPPPPPLPAGANDMLREARFVAGLADSPVPVPRVLAVSPANEVLDVPFYVMSFADGPVVTTATPAPLDNPNSRRDVGMSLVDRLADLHAVDWQAAGLGDLGRPDGFNERHLRRMSRLVADADGRPPEEFAAIETWLAAHAPAEAGASIIHNDFRIGNVVLAPDNPGRVHAVLDWELATIGDPLFDLGYFLMTVPQRGEPLTPTGRLGTAMLEDGYPGRDELAARYAERTGRSLATLPWYSALALWKLAVLYEYSARRAATGDGDEYYADSSQVPEFLEAAHRAAGIAVLRSESP
jgi:aminoglycoside phosphotransferase (APT) family kinase protein